jgi:ABC-type Fe3+-siderophore transport system permease subunit
MIGIILMTILIGLSFVGDIKIVQILCDKFIDPVRVLTFGGRNIANWNWRKVLLPCILLYLAFALFLNGNLIRIIMWGAEWYGTIMKWAKTL